MFYNGKPSTIFVRFLAKGENGSLQTKMIYVSLFCGTRNITEFKSGYIYEVTVIVTVHTQTFDISWILICIDRGKLYLMDILLSFLKDILSVSNWGRWEKPLGRNLGSTTWLHIPFNLRQTNRSKADKEIWLLGRQQQLGKAHATIGTINRSFTEHCLY